MRVLGTVLCVLAFTGLVLGDEWDYNNDPSIFNEDFVSKLSDLPKQAEAKTLPWSDTYWPSFESGVAHRWLSDDPQDFKYHLYSLEELKNLSAEAIKELSPAEKYDIYNGRYDYPTVYTEWNRTHATDPEWRGICHGWAPASVTYLQPEPTEVTNADGIKIPFGSSDVKALLSYYLAFYDDDAAEAFIGSRCNIYLDENEDSENRTECKDMNAGTLHVIFANRIGKQNLGFVIDRDRSAPVWNQPVVWYKTQFEEPVENQTSVRVKTRVAYGKETQPEWNAHDPYLIAENYDYNLELNATGHIIGGTFNQWDRIDFAWYRDVNDFHGYWTLLKEIYQNSTKDERPVIGTKLTADYFKNMMKTSTILKNVNGEFSLDAYKGKITKRWSINPLLRNELFHIEITFKHISTTKFADHIRVYEHADGEGALISALHGNKSETKVLVRSTSAQVVFTSHSASSFGKGFFATYRLIPL